MENTGRIESFKDLIVWQKAASLTTVVYKVTAGFPKEELYGLTQQIRRAAVSISSNIAEGFRRTHKKEKIQFYRVALGSLAEAESQLEIAKMLGYLSKESYDEATAYINETGKLLTRFIYSAKNKLRI